MSSLEVRKSRIKFCWSIRKEVISLLTPEITKRVPGVNLITDLLDLNYWCDASGKIHIDTSQLKVLDSINPVVLVSKKECNILSDILPKGKAFQLWAPYAPIKLEKPLSQSGREGLIFVGGFRHKPNCEAIEWFRSSVWPKLLENGYSETVRIVGTGMPTKLLEECLDSGFKVLGRVDNLDEQYLSSKIAILPLLSGRGRKGKLGEALSFGMPIIGTSVAFEDFDLKSGVEAFEANSDYEWVDAITKLSSDEKIRETLSCNALNYCASNLSREVFASGIVDILETSSSRRLGVTHA